MSNRQPNQCSWNNGITQVEEKRKSNNPCIFLWGQTEPSNSAWIFMCTTTNCENGFVSETKSHAHVREKSTLSGGGLDPSPLRWLPPVVGRMLKRLASKKQYGWNAVYLSGKHEPSPVLKHQQRVSKKPPCLVAVNWGTEVINLMFQSVNIMPLSVRKTEKRNEVKNLSV